MTMLGMHLHFSPSIVLKPDYKTCRYPVGTCRLPNRVGRIFSSGHKENHAFISSENVEVEREEVKLLWDDGHGSQTFEDYMEAVKCMLKCDGGPPRWFCPVEAGLPLKNSPLLLYLPGIDGFGMGMMLHHKAMGKVFEVRCMHIPVHDRTPYEGLVKFVENVVRDEHALCPNKPIYLVGDSFGGCIALSVAASNPTIDVVLILVNPATSFDRSKLPHLIPLLEAFPQELQVLLTYILVANFGDPIKMTNGKKIINSPTKLIEKLIHHLSASITGISSALGDDHKQSLMWKLKLLKSGAAYANSHIHAVKCEALILASGNDSMLPSTNEAERLTNLIKKSKVRVFKNNGHTLLLEDGINLLTVIKGICMYRRSKKRDPILDFLPPSQSEFQDFFVQQFGWFRVATSPVVLSTLGDGEIVRGLKGIPDEGPVLLVGYHMLLGSEISTIIDEFLREKHVLVHGLAHPEIFTKAFEDKMQENTSPLDYMKVFGAVPVTARNLLRLLSTKSYALLYPGGVREALHRKGEAYKLFWPEDPEFIVPFGVVGEDDVMELFLDYNDLMRIPPAKDMIKKNNANLVRVRDAAREKGEVSNQDFHVPGFFPKLPGRFYFLFGKAMETKGREELLKNNAGVKDLYLQIKSEVERNMSYLIKKREEDPYRHLFERLMHRLLSAKNAPLHDTPTFDP
ncbi:hypothetical protein ACS0TY_011682 [Phlomoides rotata]